MMRNLPVPVLEEDIDEMFNFADQDRDGKISWRCHHFHLAPKSVYIYMCYMYIYTIYMYMLDVQTYIQDGLTQSTNAGHNIKCKAPVLSIRSNKLLRPIQQDSVFSEFQTMVNPGSSSNGSQQPVQPTKVIVTNTPSKQQ